MERYSFFRDTDEITLAVLGEAALSADLGGNYQKPYAVLTQKRLYCKGRRHCGNKIDEGNFITNISELLTASTVRNYRGSVSIWFVLAISCYCVLYIFPFYFVLSYGANPFYELSFCDAVDIAGVVSIVLFLVLRKYKVSVICTAVHSLCILVLKDSFLWIWSNYSYIRISELNTMKTIFTGYKVFLIIDCILVILFSILYFRDYIHIHGKSTEDYRICTTGGDFLFCLKDYPQQEIVTFSKQFKAQKTV